jgi:hypothetical protein
MKGYFLEVTYRKGKPFAAYLYFRRHANCRVESSRELVPGLVADFDAADQPVGLEIISPASVGPAQIRKAAGMLHIPPVPAADLVPLKAA